MKISMNFVTIKIMLNLAKCIAIWTVQMRLIKEINKQTTS